MMVRRFVCAAFAVISLSSCDSIGLRGTIEDIVANGNAVVNIAGYYRNGSAINVPCSWTGTQKTDLPNDNYPGEARAIYVSGSDVYTAGHLDASGSQIACYWSGTQRGDLDSSTTIAEGNSIFAFDGRVYIGGQLEGNPAYWVRNNISLEATISVTGRVRGIFVDAGGTHLAGWVDPGMTGIHTPCFWTIDGITNPRTDLMVPGPGDVESIFIDNGTVYTAGSYSAPPQVSCYWTGTNRTELDANTAYATSVFVSNGVVYVGGCYLDGGIFAPCYWRNGVRTTLPAGGYDAKVSSIYVYRNMVYAAGEYSTGSDPHPCYWKNGERVELLTGSQFGSALSIFVTGPAGQN